MNTTNLRRKDGGTVIKQGDVSSQFSFQLTDENFEAIPDLSGQEATVRFLLKDKIVWEKAVVVDGAQVSFNLSEALPIGTFSLEIHVGGYVFPSDNEVKLKVEKSSKKYDVKELVDRDALVLELVGKLKSVTDLSPIISRIEVLEGQVGSRPDLAPLESAIQSLIQKVDAWVDKDTIYNDEDIRRLIQEVEDDVANFKDNDTVYNDEELRNLITEVKEAFGKMVDKDTVYDDGPVRELIAQTNQRLTEISNRPIAPQIDPELEKRVEALETAEKPDLSGFLKKTEPVTLSPEQIAQLKGDKGEDGKDGKSPTIVVGEVTTLEPDQSATVTARPSSDGVTFDFGLPRGQKGDRGQDGTGGTVDTSNLATKEDLKTLATKEEVKAATDDAESAYLKKSELATVQNDIQSNVERNLRNDPSMKGPKGDNGQDGIKGDDGEDGKSAYQSWLDLGNQGSEQDFIASLKGEQGSAGKDGENGEQGQDGLQGVPGKSAYELAVEQGYSKSLPEWLQELKGKDGVDGQDGQKGTDGVSPVISDVQLEMIGTFEEPSAELSGSQDNLTVKFKVPRSPAGPEGQPGVDGKDGKTPVLKIGQVTKTSSDQDPTVSMREVSGETLFDFSIPESKTVISDLSISSVINPNLFLTPDGIDMRKGVGHGNRVKFEDATYFKTTSPTNDYIRVPALDALTETLEAGIEYTASFLTDDKVGAINFYFNSTSNYRPTTIVELGNGQRIFSTTWRSPNTAPLTVHMNVGANEGTILKAKLEKGNVSTLIPESDRYAMQIVSMSHQMRELKAGLELVKTTLEQTGSVVRAEYQSHYLSLDEMKATGFVPGNSILSKVKFKKPFSKRPMVNITLDIQGVSPRIAYVSNVTETDFMVATSYSADLKGVWYEGWVE